MRFPSSIRAALTTVLVAGVVSTPLLVAPPAQAIADEPGTYQALTPARVLDTGSGNGAPQAPVAAAATLSVQVSGRGGVPATGVAAVVLNVTVASPTAGGYLTVFPEGSARPGTSNLNFIAGKAVPNLVVTRLGATGQVSLYNGSKGTVRLVADVAGYYRSGTPAVPGAFASVSPARVLDTGTGLGAPAAPVASHDTIDVQITGQGGIPATGVSAVVMNVTVVAPTAGGYLTVFPQGSTRPGTSNLNFPAGRTVPNLVVVKVGPSGKVSLFNGSGGTTRLIGDVAGYFLSGTANSAGAFAPLAPARVLDTATGNGAPQAPMGGQATLNLQVTGRGGVPATGVAAVVLNVTVAAPTDSGYITVFPQGVPQPGTSNLNFGATQTVPNLVVVGVGTTGQVSFYNGSAGSTRLIADVAGYYLSTPDTTPPGPVTGVTATTTTSAANLGWTNPTTTDFTGVLIRRAVGATAPATPTAGTLVADVAKPTHTRADTGLTAGTTYSYSLFAHDAAGNYAAAATKTVTTAAGLTITTASLPAGSVNTPYNQTITATGGDGNYTWDVSSVAQPPSGLTLDVSSGTLSGYPDTAGSYTFTVRVTDGTNKTATHAYTIVVHVFDFASAATLPAAQRFVAYSDQLTTQYGTAPFIFTITSGQLPDGLTMSDSGLISGTASTLGTSTFDMQAQDANFNTATRTFSLTVIDPPNPVITTTVLPGGEVGAPYLASLDAVGGTAPLTWSVASGTLPAGLTVSGGGVLSGTPTATGSSSITFRVTDAAAHSSTHAYPIPVTARTDYTQAEFDAGHTGYEPAETSITTAGVAQLRPDWSVQRDAGGVAIVSGILYAAGSVGTGGEQALTAYHLDTGVVAWQVSLPCSGSAGSNIAVTSSLVMFPCGNGLRAYSLTGSHALVWNTETQDPGVGAYGYAVLTDRVVVSGYTQVAAYRLTDGVRLWRQLIDTTNGGPQNLAVGGTTVVVPLNDRIRAFDTNTGAIKWTVTQASTSVVVSGSVAYTTLGSELAALNLTTGAILWHVTPDFPAVHVVGTGSGQVYAILNEVTADCPRWHLGAFNTTNGAKAWTADVPWDATGMALSNNLLWLTYSTFSPNCGRTGGTDVFAAGNGTLVRDLDSSNPISGLPVVAQGRYISSHYGAMTVFGSAPPLPSVPAAVLPTAWVAGAYSQPLAASGGTAPYTWALTAGTLPSGLSLSAGGVISGTPSAAATASITVRVTDARGLTATRTFVVSARAVATGTWPTTSGDNGRTGLAAGESVIGLTSYPQLTQKWHTAGVGYPKGDVAVAGGRAYVASDGDHNGVGVGDVYAYSTTGTATGVRNSLWVAMTDDNTNIQSGVTVGGTRIFVVANDGLYAFNATTGARLWKAPLNTYQPGQAPLVVGTKVYVGATDSSGYVAAFDVTTGAASWTSPWRSRLTNAYDNSLYGALSSDGTRIFAIAGCQLSAINAATGALIWDHVLSAGGVAADCPNVQTDVTPLVNGGSVYAGSGQMLGAFDAVTGAVGWQRAVAVYGAMATSNGMLVYAGFGGANGGSIYPDLEAADAATGEAMWRQTGFVPDSSPKLSIAGDLVLVPTSDQATSGFSLLTGERLWASDAVPTYLLASQSAIVDGQIYFLAGDGQLHVYGLP